MATYWALALSVAGAFTSIEAFAQPPSTEKQIEFAIPAQPLISAISRYGDVTGNEALYDASLAIGRYSNNVQGIFSPAEALERLLAGTGLSARFVAEGTFVVSPVAATGSPTASPQVSPSHLRYYALVQQGLLDTLCRLGAARPGHYRIIVVFRIAPTGAIENPLRVGTTGTVEADEQIDATLHNVAFREPPPAGFAQPVRILLAPEGGGVTSGCASADARFRASNGAR